ncbi:MAG: DUF86 domain-containing protein [Flavisolibacter sp.]|nr:DUF86 domain-containing protein [Flavisolibacter sp.]
MLASDKELLRHIQEELHFILHYTNDKTKEEMVNDPVLRRAIIRSLEIIGEAAKKPDASFKTEHAQIEWRKIAGTRDKLIHDYIGVDLGQRPSSNKKGLRINLLRPCAQYPAKGGILPKPPIIFDSFLPTIP